MSRRSPIADSNFLLEKTTPLTKNDKKLFAYFGVNVKILPHDQRRSHQHRISIYFATGISVAVLISMMVALL